MAYYIKGNIPGILSGDEYDSREKYTNIEGYIKNLIPKYILPKVIDTNDIENITNFNTKYLEQAANVGSDINGFFVEFFSPILDSIGKETDPSELLNNINRIKQDPFSYNPETDSKYMINASTKKISSGALEAIKNKLEEEGSVFNNFNKKSLSNYRRSDLDSLLDMVDNPELRADMYFDHTSTSGRKTTVPVAYIVDGMLDEKGDPLGKIITAFPFQVPEVGELFDKGEDNSLVLSDRGAEIIRKDYLKDGRVNNYSQMKIRSSQVNDPWKDALDLFIKVSEKQEEEGVDITRSVAVFNKAYNKLYQKIKFVEKKANPTDIMYSRVLDDLIRPINNAKGTDEYKSIVDISKQKGYSPKKYLELLLNKDIEKARDKADNTISDAKVRIPYDTFRKRFHINQPPKFQDSGFLYNVYQEHFEKGGKDNPLKERDIQKAINKSFTPEEKENLVYIDRNLYKGIEDKNPRIIKQFFRSNKQGEITLEPLTSEHVTPISSLKDILWDDIFLEMKRKGRDEEDIKKALKDTIMALYAEALISSEEDSFKLGGKYTSASSISDSTINKIRSGNFDPERDLDIWNRYDETKVPIPVPFSDMKKRYPAVMPGITYSDITENKKSIASMLFTYY